MSKNTFFDRCGSQMDILWLFESTLPVTSFWGLGVSEGFLSYSLLPLFRSFSWLFMCLNKLVVFQIAFTHTKLAMFSFTTAKSLCGTLLLDSTIMLSLTAVNICVLSTTESRDGKKTKHRETKCACKMWEEQCLHRDVWETKTKASTPLS